MLKFFRHIKKEPSHEKTLEKQHKKRYRAFVKDTSTHADLGRRLHDYYRIDYFIKKSFPNGIQGKKIVHLGSGNTIYCDYLASQGARAFAVDKDKSYLKNAKLLGSKALRVNNCANKIKLRPNSVDIFISDHFLFSSYGINDYDIIEHIVPAIKKGGFIIFERAEIANGCINWLRDIGLHLIENDSNKEKNASFVGKEFFVFKKTI